MFHDAGHALDWAYNTAAKPIVKMSGINNMIKNPTRGAENPLLINLTVQDKHGQSALIIGLVEKLDQTGREYIAARFGRRLEKVDMTVLVYRGCEAVGLGLGGQEPVYRIMRSYFGGRGMPYRTIQRMLGCRNQYALMVKSCLYDVLDTIHDRSMADMTEIFERHGLISAPGCYSNSVDFDGVKT